jgi:hypothetical protein
MRITIHVEDTDADKLQWEIERRVRLEQVAYPSEAKVAPGPVTNYAEPMPVPKPEPKPRKRKR